MNRLREQDLRAVIALLQEAYAQPDLDTDAAYTVGALPRVVGGQRASYNEADPRLGTIRAVIKPDDGGARLNARQYREHPMFQERVHRKLGVDNRAAAARAHEMWATRPITPD